MILVDTSIWVDYFRRDSEHFSELLHRAEIVCHPFVIGELSCGNLKNRHKILGFLKALPTSKLAEGEEVLELIESRGLMGQGIGWIDAHLIASALLSGVTLWTRDKRLRSLSALLGVMYSGSK